MRDKILAIDVARKNVVTCHPNEHLRNVTKMMVDHWISSIIVVEGDKPVGIVTDGIILRLIAKGRNPLEFVAADIMVSPVYTIQINNTLKEAQNVFMKTKVHRLAIVNEKEKLVGIVNKKDVERYKAHSVAERIIYKRHSHK